MLAVISWRGAANIGKHPFGPFFCVVPSLILIALPAMGRPGQLLGGKPTGEGSVARLRRSALFGFPYRRGRLSWEDR
jgi:hypothetical protein